MKNICRILIASIFLGTLGIPVVEASPVMACGADQTCASVEYGSIAGIISAGNGIGALTMKNVAQISDTGGISVIVTIPSATTPTMTWTLANLNGCTSGTATTQASPQMYSYQVDLTLSDNTCTGTIRSQITGGILATEFWDWEPRFTIQAEQDVSNHLCTRSVGSCVSSTGDVSVHVCNGITGTCVATGTVLNTDNQNRLCDASPLGTTCLDPELILDNHVCNGIATTCNATGTLVNADNQNRLCKGSGLGQLCDNPVMLNSNCEVPNFGVTTGDCLGSTAKPMVLDNHVCNGTPNTCLGDNAGLININCDGKQFRVDGSCTAPRMILCGPDGLVESADYPETRYPSNPNVVIVRTNFNGGHPDDTVSADINDGRYMVCAPLQVNSHSCDKTINPNVNQDATAQEACPQDALTLMCDGKFYDSQTQCTPPRITLCGPSYITGAEYNPDYINQPFVYQAQQLVDGTNRATDEIINGIGNNLLNLACSPLSVDSHQCDKTVVAGIDGAQQSKLCPGNAQSTFTAGNLSLTVVPCSTAALELDVHACDVHYCGPNNDLSDPTTCRSMDQNITLDGSIIASPGSNVALNPTSNCRLQYMTPLVDAVEGIVTFCINYPEIVPTSTTVFNVAATLQFPVETVASDRDVVLSEVVGCGSTDAFVNQDDAYYAKHWTFTMASTHCTGVAKYHYQPSDGSDPIYGTTIPFNIRAADATTFSSENLVIDSWPELTSHVNNSGILFVNNTGSQTFTIASWPTLLTDIIRSNQTVCIVTSTDGCGSAVDLNTINSGTLAVVNSGGQVFEITDWPQLEAILSNCLVQTYGQVTGDCNDVAFNSTNTNTFDFPENLNVTNSGELSIHQDEACGASITCLSDASFAGSFNTTSIESQSLFEQKFGLSGIEFGFMIAFMFICIFFWSRSQDAWIQLGCSFMMMVLALMWMQLWLSTHNRLEFILMLLAFFTGLYMLARMSMDLLENKKKGKTNT